MFKGSLKHRLAVGTLAIKSSYKVLWHREVLKYLLAIEEKIMHFSRDSFLKVFQPKNSS